ncbi:hypothetical protein KJ641_04550 [Patescibacteria group bacterium]|nr:hypothetical protein [Patescibacteria group bacterium]MBU1896105.1 hypothetical protein [Patescibacteria group bacterium]
MGKYIVVGFFVSLIMGIFVFLPKTAFAIDSEALETQTRAFSSGADLGEAKDPRSIVALIIKFSLGLLGVAFVAYLVYGGFLIMTSGGVEENVTKGKKIIFTAIIGIAIILSAYSISYFVSNQLLIATFK